MARITYDDENATAFKAVREVPRDGLGRWRDAIRRHLSPAEFLAQADTFRRADSPMRTLTEEEFLRGKDRLRRAAQAAEKTPTPEPRTSLLDLLVLR